ncbi:MAG: anti-sigma factor [Burkholderiaceae bacterium]|nr:anti-sigma factor [Burkholderiaceae bacterium]
MSRPDEFTDTDLSAWLDHELDAERRARLDARLREQPELAARARLWAADRDALRARFDPVLGEPLPPALVHRVWQHSSQPRWTQAAVAAGLLLAGSLIGAGGMWQWQGKQLAATLAGAQAGLPAGWVQRAALAHSVYVPEPRHAVEVKAQEEHLARWLTRRIDIPVKLFDLRDEGFELVGGRLLPDATGKSAQLMYESIGPASPKQRVTVYLRKPDVSAPTAFSYRQQGELGQFYWVEAGAGYALVGALPKERLLAMAQAIYKQQPPPLSASEAAR